jgi:hypothetical protein
MVRRTPRNRPESRGIRLGALRGNACSSQAKSGVQRRISFFLPCRRSWVRVPSAASKALQIGTFLVSRVVSVLRRRSRVRSPSANLGKAPARRAVPAASSGRLARADQVFLSWGTIGGQNPRPPHDRRSDRGPGWGAAARLRPLCLMGPLGRSPTVGSARSLPKACVTSAPSRTPACRPTRQWALPRVASPNCCK